VDSVARNTVNRSLNDSGLSEAGSVDLTDEVDGVDNVQDSVEDNVFAFLSGSIHNSASHVLDTAAEDSEERVREGRESMPEGNAQESGFVSSPSTQLSLLSSLSSGSHRLTQDGNDVTATRIQSLANEILVLLQEEAEAHEDEEDEDDEGDEEDTDDDDDDVELEGDEEVENEP
jgi:hypothetical protein